MVFIVGSLDYGQTIDTNANTDLNTNTSCLYRSKVLISSILALYLLGIRSIVSHSTDVNQWISY